MPGHDGGFACALAAAIGCFVIGDIVQFQIIQFAGVADAAGAITITIAVTTAAIAGRSLIASGTGPTAAIAVASWSRASFVAIGDQFRFFRIDLASFIVQRCVFVCHGSGGRAASSAATAAATGTLFALFLAPVNCRAGAGFQFELRLFVIMLKIEIRFDETVAAGCSGSRGWFLAPGRPPAARTSFAGTIVARTVFAGTGFALPVPIVLCIARTTFDCRRPFRSPGIASFRGF